MRVVRPIRATGDSEATNPAPLNRGKHVRDRLRQELLLRLERGEWRPGTRVAPEAELARTLGVSRPTLREVLQGLQEEGYVRRVRGGGTFITYRQRLTNNLDKNFGVSELIESMGMTPGTENLHVFRGMATNEEGEQLSLPARSAVMVVERIRTADTRPVVFSRDVLAIAKLPPKLMDAVERLGQRSLYDVLNEHGISVAYGHVSVRPAVSDREISANLRIQGSTLLLYMVQVDFDQLGRPILLSHEYHVASEFDFTVHRTGSI